MSDRNLTARMRYAHEKCCSSGWSLLDTAADLLNERAAEIERLEGILGNVHTVERTHAEDDWELAGAKWVRLNCGHAGMNDLDAANNLIDEQAAEIEKLKALSRDHQNAVADVRRQAAKDASEEDGVGDTEFLPTAGDVIELLVRRTERRIERLESILDNVHTVERIHAKDEWELKAKERSDAE